MKEQRCCAGLTAYYLILMIDDDINTFAGRGAVNRT